MIIGLNENENKIVNNILKKYEDNYDFFYYGSRVKGNFRQGSDLDVMIKSLDGKQVHYRIIDELKGLFDVSALSFIVNFVDYYDIKDNFYKNIENHIVRADIHNDLNNKIIILNGTSSAGKSSIIREFIELYNGCFYNYSMDRVHSFLPTKYRIYYNHKDLDKTCQNTLTDENKKGFYFENSEKCLMGEYAKNISNDMIDMLFTLTLNNRNVIVDYVLYGLNDLKNIATKFRNIDNVYIIRVFCEDEELSKRELQRGDRVIGSAVNSQKLIDTKYNDYVLNSTSKTPLELAKELLNFIENNKAKQLKELFFSIK